MDHKPVKPQPMAASDSVNSQRTRRRAHSFSSLLLESICQSMDEDDHHSSRQSQHIGDAQSNKTVKTHSHISHHQPQHIKASKQSRTKTSASYAEIALLQAGQVTKSEKPIHRVHEPSFSSSSVFYNFSYSDSSSTHGRLSSSISSYGPGSRDSSSSSCFSTCSSKSPKSSIKEKINKAKLRAIKLYTELKTPKKNKPISPRCGLATYLNSLFTPRKQNKTEQLDDAVTAPQKTYTKPNTTSITKLKHLPPPTSGSGREMYNDQDASVSMKMMRRDHQDKAKGREIFKKCQEKIVRGLKMREFVEELCDDGDNDAESYASSDLFELEFLMERGGEELPVFETTDIKINQAIANGFSL